MHQPVPSHDDKGTHYPIAMIFAKQNDAAAQPQAAQTTRGNHEHVGIMERRESPATCDS
jgi:hypothetical protein